MIEIQNIQIIEEVRGCSHSHHSCLPHQNRSALKIIEKVRGKTPLTIPACHTRDPKPYGK